jgi:fused signal recognition particle receptor
MFDFLKKLIKGKDSGKPEIENKPLQKKVVKKTKAKDTSKKKDTQKLKKTNTSKDSKTKSTRKPSVNSDSNTKQNSEKTLSFSEKIKLGLKKTREAISTNISSLIESGSIDDEFYEDLEFSLITADVGYQATQMILEKLKKEVKINGLKESQELKPLLKKILVELLKKIESPLIEINSTPFVILVVGVNGAGKTTTIGKLTKLLLDENKSVLIAAGDTFRAAAKEQLQVWGDRNNVTVISQATGDPSAVIFDSMQSAKAKGIDIVIADTAGRLPTQKHLIDELEKIKRVIQKFDSNAPHETVLVLDANTGQNALNQIKTFNEAVPLSGLIMTKLDGTAKGGIVAAIAQEYSIPMRFIGVGEQIDDLKIFSAEHYVEGLIE